MVEVQVLLPRPNFMENYDEIYDDGPVTEHHESNHGFWIMLVLLVVGIVGWHAADLYLKPPPFVVHFQAYAAPVVRIDFPPPKWNIDCTYINTRTRRVTANDGCFTGHRVKSLPEAAQVPAGQEKQSFGGD